MTARPGSLLGAAATVVLLLAASFALPAFLSPALDSVRAADPSTCASLYPTVGPGGVDLQAACVAGRVAQHYTSPGTATVDVPSTLLLVLAVSWALAVVALAGARWLGSRAARRTAAVAPAAVWLCDACHSFNDTENGVCYRCRRPRPEGAPSVATGEPPVVEQSFGRPFGR